GYDHVCAIDKAANLWCWGHGGSGRLGFAAGPLNGVPRLVASTIDRWLEIAAGQQHTCGIKADGSLWCWGQNKEGQLGVGNLDDSSIPIRVGHDQDWATVSLGLESDHLSCASKVDGRIFCWGSNLNGQLGDGRGDQSIPTKIGDGYSSVAVGEAHSCALKTDQTLWAGSAAANPQLSELIISPAGQCSVCLDGAT
ncbi:MAG TPA: hypothetical protein EYN66_09065, partial [Myxococcales bacterium]|nr:hypothetical protein [Myxococcales bacterium]